MQDNTILIVDDETEICLLLGGFLRSQGYEVSTAHSVKEGMELLQQKPAKLAILDINLPDGLGFDLIPHLRKSEEAKVVIISAREGEHEKNLMKKYAVDAFLLKPFRRSSVLNVVEKITQK